MMGAQYILRFDDICPTMNWDVWGQVEAILIDSGIRPLLAVVPDNGDPALAVSPVRDDFWSTVRRWQEMGWAIGLHGYRHLYQTSEAGILGLNTRSEFAGLSYDVQLENLRKALAVFASNGVRTNTWVAPAHSFDQITLEVLPRFGINRVSDGFHLLPGVDASGLLWIPQQLWELMPRPFGIWTVCLHINHWNHDNVAAFARNVARFAASITDFDTISNRFAARRMSVIDRAAAAAVSRYIRFRRALR